MSQDDLFNTTIFTHQRRHGWTDEELARRMGISRPLVSLVRKRKRRITQDFVRGALRAFQEDGLRFRDLFHVEG